jgi:hypothetical protein
VQLEILKSSHGGARLDAESRGNLKNLKSQRPGDGRQGGVVVFELADVVDALTFAPA